MRSFHETPQESIIDKRIISPMDFQGASFSSLSHDFRKYDVFMNFRGEDTRRNFTAHLHDALLRKNIIIFIDDKLPRGDEISLTLLKAIESSKISIVILSKNYSSSPWCLNELLKIMECKKTKQQKVIPVFYDVNPTEVRDQTTSFRQALAKLKDRCKDETMVQSWNSALTEVAGLSGFHLRDRNEPEIIQRIVQEVSKSVNGKCLNVARHLVGIESKLQHVHNKLLSVGVNDTCILGIYGIGGTGKTTLAKAIYNSLIDQFEDSCFLADVRETSKRENGLIQLQETFLRKILGEKSLKVENVDDGINLLKETVFGKRVLLLLDDVDQLFQIENLLGECDLFGLGSIIIITTRDEHLLASYNVHLRYKVKELDHDEALLLFCWNAFKTEKPHHDFVEITEDVTHYAGGLPLALKVLGSYLHGRDIHHWKSAFEKYKRIPHNDIQKILRISYDGLEESEKDIFLDIACFFTGEQVEYVTNILDGCGFFSDIGIKVLMDKSLITIEFGKIVMHDLLKDMGREIIRQESKEPGKRSRLWFHEDVRYILEEAKGTNKIQGILVELPEEDWINLNPKAFLKMTSLRIFINRNARFSRRLNYLSNELRVFDWHAYPGPSFPLNFHGKKLIILKMGETLLKELGDGVKNFQNLKAMRFSGCKFLTKIPDLSGLQSLESLEILSCPNLVEVHPSIGFLDKLVRLTIAFCQNFTSFPRSLKLRSLKTLSFSHCKRLQKFPEIESEMKCLRSVQINGTAIKELPLSVGNLTGLEYLDLCECYKLRHIPYRILQLQNLTLRYLNLGCYSDKRKNRLPPSIAELISSPPPMNSVSQKLQKLNLQRRASRSKIDQIMLAACFSTLENLDISGGNVLLPVWNRGFVRLRDLSLNYCKQLKLKEFILELPPNIKEVDATGCMSLDLESFPQETKKFEINTSGGTLRRLRSI